MIKPVIKCLAVFVGALMILVMGFFGLGVLALYKEKNGLLSFEVMDYQLILIFLVFYTLFFYIYLVFKKGVGVRRKALCFVATIIAVPFSYLLAKNIIGKIFGFLFNHLQFDWLLSAISSISMIEIFVFLMSPSILAAEIAFYIQFRIFRYYIPKNRKLIMNKALEIP
ncbi:MAG: hypothetical protein SFT92_04990 [Rickettsiales bacterium]|nr:hypothetical protein [Rickettsiales bacterium]